ncbi:MAG: alanine dehydrogenase [Nitrospirae bacterium]|nr:alanine dehydrogenase [Nitrospirota bacterium]
MNIGIPKEVKDHEYRVGITPEGASELVHRGHVLWLESQAGVGSGFLDEEYSHVGVHVTSSKDELFAECSFIVKVKDPLVEECVYLREHHIIFTYLHLAANVELTNALLASGCTALAYETLEDEFGELPILHPMSEIAGRMAVQIGAHFLERGQGGRGVLLGGVPGVLSGRVVILGSGVVGSSSAKIAIGMGANVTVLSIDLSQLRDLDVRYPGQVQTCFATKEAIAHAVRSADLLIGAVMVRGAKSPTLVSQTLVSQMLKKSVIIDVGIDQGGCVETIRPTTHTAPIFEIHNVLHYGVTNIPGIVPRTSTMALTHATLPFIIRLAEGGTETAFQGNSGLSRGVNIRQGKVTYKAVAEAHGLTFHSLG